MTMITIVIPTFNRAEFILETIESCLAQTYSATEIIVVDDGSTDNTEEIVKKLPVTYIKKENGGVATARNLGIKNAKTKYVLPLDSDDTLDKDYLKSMFDAMDNKDNRVVSTWIKKIYTNGTFEDICWPQPPKNIFNENFASSCSLFSKSAWEKIGGYDENRQLMGWEDWEFYIRLYQNGCEFKIIEKHLFNYRIHNGPTISRNYLKDRARLREYMSKKHNIYYMY